MWEWKSPCKDWPAPDRSGRPKARNPHGSDLQFLSALAAQPWDQAAQSQVTDFEPAVPLP